jgi:hypothetical protein
LGYPGARHNAAGAVLTIQSLVLWGLWLTTVNVFVFLAARAEARRSKKNWLIVSMGLGWLKGSTPESLRYRRYAIGTLIIGAIVCFVVDTMSRG